MTLPARDQAAAVAETGKRAIDLPAPAVAAQFVPVLGLGLLAGAPPRRHQLNIAARQAGAYRSTIMAFAGDQALEFLAPPARFSSLHRRPFDLRAGSAALAKGR